MKIFTIQQIFFGFLFTISFLSTSCFGGRATQLSLLTNEESKKIKPMSKEIIRCFTENDKEALINLFCEKVRSQSSFKNQVDNAMDFFVCDSYTKSVLNDVAGGGSSIHEGEKIKWYVTPEITLIKVLVRKDGNPSNPLEHRYYSINYFWSIMDKNNKSLEGLQYIEIELLNIKSVEIGKHEFMR